MYGLKAGFSQAAARTYPPSSALSFSAACEARTYQPVPRHFNFSVAFEAVPFLVHM
jgi:hypothetical protein